MRHKWLAVAAGLVGMVALVVALAGPGISFGGDPSPSMRLAGHGATCNDGVDNDGDGRADAEDLDDCLGARPGRQPDHEEDENPSRGPRPRVQPGV
ncbi:MAG: hypothetical protein ACRDZ7_16625 [Acidimicrobiia bacterium]